MTILMWREMRLLQYSVGMKNGAFLCGKPHQLADHYPLPVVKMSLGIDPQADAGVSSWPNNPSLKRLSIPAILPDFAGVLLVVFVLVFVQRARHGAHDARLAFAGRGDNRRVQSELLGISRRTFHLIFSLQADGQHAEADHACHIGRSLAVLCNGCGIQKATKKNRIRKRELTNNSCQLALFSMQWWENVATALPQRLLNLDFSFYC